MQIDRRPDLHTPGTRPAELDGSSTGPELELLERPRKLHQAWQPRAEPLPAPAPAELPLAGTLSAIAQSLRSLLDQVADRIADLRGHEQLAPSTDAAASPDTQALASVQQAVEQRLANQAFDAKGFDGLLRQAFGEQIDAAQASSLREQLRRGDSGWLPHIEVVSSRALADLSGQQGRAGVQGMAQGAYAQASHTIYLSRELLHADPQAAEQVLMEEIGHAIDARLNQSDTQGDEGAVFARLMRGDALSAQERRTLQSENDHGQAQLQGQAQDVEYSWREWREMAFEEVYEPYEPYEPYQPYQPYEPPNYEPSNYEPPLWTEPQAAPAEPVWEAPQWEEPRFDSIDRYASFDDFDRDEPWAFVPPPAEPQPAPAAELPPPTAEPMPAPAEPHWQEQAHERDTPWARYEPPAYAPPAYVPPPPAEPIAAPVSLAPAPVWAPSESQEAQTTSINWQDYALPRGSALVQPPAPQEPESASATTQRQDLQQGESGESGNQRPANASNASNASAEQTPTWGTTSTFTLTSASNAAATGTAPFDPRNWNATMAIPPGYLPWGNGIAEEGYVRAEQAQTTGMVTTSGGGGGSSFGGMTFGWSRSWQDYGWESQEAMDRGTGNGPSSGSQGGSVGNTGDGGGRTPSVNTPSIDWTPIDLGPDLQPVPTSFGADTEGDGSGTSSSGTSSSGTSGSGTSGNATSGAAQGNQTTSHDYRNGSDIESDNAAGGGSGTTGYTGGSDSMGGSAGAGSTQGSPAPGAGSGTDSGSANGAPDTGASSNRPVIGYNAAGQAIYGTGGYVPQGEIKPVTDAPVLTAGNAGLFADAHGATPLRDESGTLLYRVNGGAQDGQIVRIDAPSAQRDPNITQLETVVVTGSRSGGPVANSGNEPEPTDPSLASGAVLFGLGTAGVQTGGAAQGGATFVSRLAPAARAILAAEMRSGYIPLVVLAGGSMAVAAWLTSRHGEMGFDMLDPQDLGPNHTGNTRPLPQQGPIHTGHTTPPPPDLSLLPGAPIDEPIRPIVLPNPIPAPADWREFIVNQDGEKEFIPSRTEPTGQMGGEATGPRTTNTPNAGPNNKTDIQAENDAADAAANAGYKVERNPALTPEEYEAQGLNQNKNPDLRIEGKAFDVKASGDAASAQGQIRDSLGEGQSRRFLISTDKFADPEAGARELATRLRDNPLPGLQEVKVVVHGVIRTIFP